MMYGYLKRILELKDLLNVPKSLATRDLAQRFTSALSDVMGEFATAKLHEPTLKRPHVILRAFNRVFGWRYYPLGILKLLSDSLGFAGPLLLNELILYIEDGTAPRWQGFMWASLLALSTLLSSLFNSQYTYAVNKAQVYVRAAVVGTVYQKAIRARTTVGAPQTSVNTEHLTEMEAEQARTEQEQTEEGSSVSAPKTTGEVVNMMSTDCDRIAGFCPSFHQFWSLPFQIGVSLYLLYREVGISFLAGLIFAILLIPLNRYVCVKIGKLSAAMMGRKDARVKLINEVLHGIRVVKLYGWELNFLGRIEALRALEVKNLKGRKYLDAICVYFWATTPILISILTFGTYSLLGNQLTAATVFTSFSLFNMLIGPLNAFPWVINGIVEAWVSLKRVESYMFCSEISPHIYHDQSAMENPRNVIEMHGASFTWRDAIDEDITEAELDRICVLKDITLSLPPGQLLCVTGKVACGKSSLLTAILGELSLARGQLCVARHILDVGGFGHVPQEPWILNASLRDNIVFGQPFDASYYQKVLSACALQQDLHSLPGGDLVELGENGINLSGGQKARVSLARAVYQRKEVYLLDDPLAALDPQVALHVLEHCILGLLSGTTRILCTHNRAAVAKAHRVVQIVDKTLVNVASSEQLDNAPADVTYREIPLSKEEQPKKGHLRDVKAVKPADAADICSAQQTCEAPKESRLIADEDRAIGVVQLSVYKDYWRAAGTLLSASVFISLFLMQASDNASDMWLSHWVNAVSNTSANSTAGVSFYLSVYGYISIGNSAFTLMRAFTFAYAGIMAALVIHSKLLTSVLQAPIKFFDTTPIGRIINRFSSDVYGIDDSLPFILNILLAQAAGLLGTIIVTCYGLPYFALFLLPLGAIYYSIQRFYRQTSREVKRLMSITRSPIYSHFSETLTGVVTIRAMRQSDRFEDTNYTRLHQNQIAAYNEQAVSQWLNIRLQMIGVAMVTIVSFLSITEHSSESASSSPGYIGLSLSYALSVTNLLQGTSSIYNH